MRTTLPRFDWVNKFPQTDKTVGRPFKIDFYLAGKTGMGLIMHLDFKGPSVTRKMAP